MMTPERLKKITERWGPLKHYPWVIATDIKSINLPKLAITAAKEDVPDLLAEIERLKAENERLKANNEKLVFRLGGTFKNNAAPLDKEPK